MGIIEDSHPLKILGLLKRFHSLVDVFFTFFYLFNIDILLSVDAYIS